MSAAAILVACQSALAFLVAIAAGVLWLLMLWGGASARTVRFWAVVALAAVAVGWLLGWAAVRS